MATGKAKSVKTEPIQIRFAVRDYEISIADARKLVHVFVDDSYPLFGELRDAKGKKIKLSAARSKEIQTEFDAWSEINDALAFLRDRDGIRSRITPGLAEAFLATLLTGALVSPEDWNPIDLDFTAKEFDSFYWSFEDGDFDNLTVFLRGEDHRTALLSLLKRIRKECFADVLAKWKAHKENAEAEKQQEQERRAQAQAKEMERRRNEQIKALRALGYTVTPPKAEKAPNLPEILNEGMAATVPKAAFKPAAKKPVKKTAPKHLKEEWAK